MQMDDMILVSIDDHMVEPPDMFENHVPAKWRDQAPKVVRNERRASTSGCSRARATSTPFGMAATVGWPSRGVGLQPRLALRAAPGLLRRARAGAGHERQRRPGVDVLPDDGRLQRPHVQRGARQGARRSSCSRPTTTGTSTSGAARYPGRFIPLGVVPAVGRRPRRRRGPPARQEGLPLHQLPRGAAHVRAARASCPATGTRCWRRWSTTNMVLSLHIGAGVVAHHAGAGGGRSTT